MTGLASEHRYERQWTFLLLPDSQEGDRNSRYDLPTPADVHGGCQFISEVGEPVLLDDIQESLSELVELLK
jgi:hypothetical protein